MECKGCRESRLCGAGPAMEAGRPVCVLTEDLAVASSRRCLEMRAAVELTADGLACITVCGRRLAADPLGLCMYGGVSRAPYARARHVCMVSQQTEQHVSEQPLFTRVRNLLYTTCTA